MIARFALVLALCALPAACNAPPPAGADARTPGFTGTTVIPGNNSTIAGDAEATYLQQKWGGMSPWR